MTSTHSLWQFIRREPVLSISFVCALVSAFFVPPPPPMWTISTCGYCVCCFV